MTDWPDIEPEFRRTVFAMRRRGMTFAEVGREIPVSRRTMTRLMAKRVVPNPATIRAIELLVERHVAHSTNGAGDDD